MLVPADDAGLLVPGAEHDARRGLAVEREAMHRGAVGVAVQQQRYVVLAHTLLHGGLVHVHDVVGLRGDLRCAQLPQVGCDLAALGERFREELALPGRIAKLPRKPM